MDIGRIFDDAWKLFVKDVAALILGALIVFFLSIVSLGILAGPLWGGMYRMVTRRVREGRPADIGDVFSAFDRFWTLFAAALVMTILIGLGLLFVIVPGLLLAAIWLYVPLFIVDKGMGLGEAMAASRRLVSANGLGLHVAVVLVIALLSFLVGNIVGVGFLLTWPLTVTFVTVMYFRGGEGALVDAAGGTPVPAGPSTWMAPAAPGVPQAPVAATPPFAGQPPAPATPRPSESPAPPFAGQLPAATLDPSPALAPDALPGTARAEPGAGTPLAGTPHAEPGPSSPPGEPGPSGAPEEPGPGASSDG